MRETETAAARRDKIRRLAAETTVPGERQAALNALERLGPTPPKPAYGSPPYVEAMTRHKDVVDYCSVHRDLATLTREELKTIRNWTKYIGDPWEPGAAELMRIHRKIKAARDE